MVFEATTPNGESVFRILVRTVAEITLLHVNANTLQMFECARPDQHTVTIYEYLWMVKGSVCAERNQMKIAENTSPAVFVR